MNVVKRSEYCNGVSVKEVKPLMLSDIPMGTVFRAKMAYACNPPHVWVRGVANAVCIGEASVSMPIGYNAFGNPGNWSVVFDYEVLNATLVIEGE